MRNSILPTFKINWTYKGIDYYRNIFNTQVFPNDKIVRQVYALLINANKEVAVVMNHSNISMLPGGKTEHSEKPLQTLEREVKEETNCDIDIKMAKPFFFQEVFQKLDTGKWKSLGLELRYVVPVKTYGKFESDPDNGNIIEVKWVHYTKIAEAIAWWGETAKFIQNELPKYISLIDQ